MEAPDGEIERRRVTSSRNSQIHAAIDEKADLVEVAGLDGYEPGSVFPPVRRLEVSATFDKCLHLCQVAERNSAVERRPGELCLVGASIEEQLDRVEAAEPGQNG